MHYYQHHIGDFIRDTARLSDTFCMTYLRLLWVYYDQESPLEDDIPTLAVKVGAEEQVVKTILQTFFTLEGGLIGGLWKHARCEAEIARFKAMSDGGRKGALKRWHKGGDSPPIGEGNAPPIATNTHKPKDIYPPEFLDFWSAYPRKDGKFAAYKKWQVASKSFPAEMIRDKAAAYANERAGQDPKFTLLAETWINKRRFLDVVPQRRQSLNALAG